MTRPALLKIICGLALDRLHVAIDLLTNFVDTRPNLYMTFLVLYIFVALGIAGNLEQEPQMTIAQEESR